MLHNVKITVAFVVALLAVTLLCGCSKTWTVSFDTDGGSEISTQSVDNGARIIKPEDPTKAGYSFVRWTCFDEPWSFVDNAVTEDLTLKAVWAVNNYEIRIVDGTSVSAKRVEFGKEYRLNEPTKIGYTFAGYYLNGERFDPVGIYVYPESITVTAKWNINIYTATFFAFGEKVGTTTFTVEDKELKNVPYCKKYGYPVAWQYTMEPKNISIYSDTVYFGEYEQDNNIGSKEKIEWYILDEEDGKVLLLSKYGLDCIKYKEEYKGTTWETSDARKWLNETFFTTAFTKAEQSRIQVTNVIPDKSMEKDLDFGNATEDRLFLLSKAEVEKYLDIDKRYCKVTEYAVKNRAYKNYVTNDTMWMLRSVGWDEAHIYIVSDYQAEFYNMAEVSMLMYSVRPAMWVAINN